MMVAIEEGQNVERMLKLDAALRQMSQRQGKPVVSEAALASGAVATLYREDGTKEVVPATQALLDRFEVALRTTDAMLSVHFNPARARDAVVNQPGKVILRRFVKEQAPHLPKPSAPHGDILVLYVPSPAAGEV